MVFVAKLGKMQLMRSGKVRIVTDSGEVYDVNSGIAVAFAQYLADIDLKSGTSTSETASNMAASHNSKASHNGKDTNRKTIGGDLYLMGRITHKLVVTPLHNTMEINKPAARKASSDDAFSSMLPVNGGEYIAEETDNVGELHIGGDHQQGGEYMNAGTMEYEL